MPDIITITDLELWTRIGVTKDERAAEQRVLLSVELETDTRKAAAKDDHRLSIDYAAVAERLRALAGTDRRTVERLAEDAAALLLRKFRPQSVTVTVTKFPLPGTSDACVCITRNGRLR